MRFKIEKLLIFVFVVRILTLVLPWLTINLLFPDNHTINFLQFTSTAWSRWDASHYLYLAQHWYTSIGDEANFIVFFPLYPLILKPIGFILGNIDVSGIVASLALFIAGEYFFYKLVAIDYSQKIAAYSLIALAIFPNFLFLQYTIYRIFIFIDIQSVDVYGQERKMDSIRNICWAWCYHKTIRIPIIARNSDRMVNKSKKDWKYIPIIIVPTIIAGVSYLYLNKIVFGNPLEFQKILAVHWQKHLTSPVSSILNSWKIALSGNLSSFGVMVGWAESVTITLSWILIPFVFKYLRKSWAVYYTLSILLFSSTSFILSTPRYLLSIHLFLY